MKKPILLFLMFILTFPVSLKATNYYISNSGNDLNQGTFSSPFKTIQKGANTAVAGDTVFVTTGFYPEVVYFPNSGSDYKYIVFIAIGLVTVEDPCPLTGSCGVWTFGGIFRLEYKNNLIIDGFHLQNSYWFGIYINYCFNIIIKNIHTNTTGGSGIYGRNSAGIKILNNLVEKACYHTSSTSTVSSQEQISLVTTSNFEIASNEVRYSGFSEANFALATGGEGIDIKKGCQNGSIHDNLVHDILKLGIYVDSWDTLNKNITIYNNRVWNCREGIVIASEAGGEVEGVQVYNNICYNNEQAGISITSYGTNGPKKNITIINNTIFNNGYKIYSCGVTGGGITFSSSNISNVIVRNNIVSKNNRWQIKSQASIISDHNLIDGYRGAQQEIIAGITDVTGDPQFSSSVEYDLKLLSTSPSIDSANPIFFPAKDFAGINRPQGRNADIGAYEFPVTSSIILKDANHSVLIYPNPSERSFNMRISDEILLNNVMIKIFDLGGIEVKSSSINNHKTTIDIAELQSGIYFYTIKNNFENIGNGKLIVQ